MSDFAPGIDSMRAAGIPVTRAPYADGAAGIRQSLEAMAAKMREGRLDGDVRGWALGCLKSKGLDGRGRQSVRAQAAALLECFREATVYSADPYGAEFVPSAAATLCLRPGLCVNGDDCDGLSTALGAVMLSVGIPTMIVKQNFGGGQQEHVLIAIHDGNDWLYADPSTKMPLGSALSATNEEWHDPMLPIGNLSEAAPEIVTMGRPSAMAHWPQAAPTPHWPVGVGAGVVTPGDVLAYRNMWNDFVVGTARAAATCAAAWQALAVKGAPSTPPNVGQFATPPDPATMTVWAATQQTYSDDLMASWNLHAGAPDFEIVTFAGDILQDFQKTVQRAGEFYQPQIAKDCPALALPQPPSLELQKQVIGQIEGLGILAHGVLQLLGIGAGGFLAPFAWLGHQIANPPKLPDYTGLLVGLVIGGVVVLGGVVYIATATAPLRR
jgi:hypothetical protein